MRHGRSSRPWNVHRGATRTGPALIRPQEPGRRRRPFRGRRRLLGVTGGSDAVTRTRFQRDDATSRSASRARRRRRPCDTARLLDESAARRLPGARGRQRTGGSRARPRPRSRCRAARDQHARARRFRPRGRTPGGRAHARAAADLPDDRGRSADQGAGVRDGSARRHREALRSQRRHLVHRAGCGSGRSAAATLGRRPLPSRRGAAGRRSARSRRSARARPGSGWVHQRAR